MENAYFIDGVNVTSPFKATPGTQLPHNFVRAVEVKAGGYEARYGKATGAVVNAVTYSGTNEFEWSTFVFSTHGGAAATPRAEPTIRSTAGVSYDLGLRVSGPIRRDRIWYSAAVNPQRDEAERTIAGHGPYMDRRSSHMFAGKLTWQARPNAELELSLFGDPTTHDAVRVPYDLPAGYAVSNPDPYLKRFETGGVVASLKGTATLGDNLLLEGALARANGREREGPRTEFGRTALYFVDDVARTVSGGNYVFENTRTFRTSASVHMTSTRPRHTIGVGAEYEDAAMDRSWSVPSGFHFLDDSYYVLEQGSRNTFRTGVRTLYVQDAWRLSERLVANLGVRWSSQLLYGASGGLAQRLADEWQPRLGLVWQPDATGRRRVFASAGRFTLQVPLNLGSYRYADYPFLIMLYDSDPRVPGVTPVETFDFSPRETDYALQTPRPRADNYLEWSAGIEQQIGNHATVSARVVRRDLETGFMAGFGPDGAVVGNPGSGDFDFLPEVERRYRALELTLHGWWTAATYRASYVYSRNRGNYTGLYSTDLGENFINPGTPALFFAAHQAENSYGALPNDRPHVLKLAGVVQATRRLSLGSTLSVMSGSPRNDLAPGPYPYMVNLRTFVEPRGSVGRTPTLWELNLRAAFTMTTTAAGQVRIVLDALNFGNPQIAVMQEDLHYLMNVEGVASEENPSYGDPIRFQRPALFRLGVEIGR